jgi:hypothetical protein
LFRQRAGLEIIRYEYFIPSCEMCEDADSFSDSKTLANAAPGARRECVDYGAHLMKDAKDAEDAIRTCIPRPAICVCINKSLWLELFNVITPVDR